MSMLAESKKKQKLSLNPRGNDWANDESKFGQKIMEKMGWKKGAGLGANEDGNRDAIKVRQKMGREGVGCTKKNVDDWIAHQDDFSAILAELNASHVTTSIANNTASNENGRITTEPLLSLSEKSKMSRSRVHYTKFTQGKDLSLRKEQDLNCIFGKRVSSTSDLQSVATTSEELTDMRDGVDRSFGVQTTTSSSSVAEYFANKMAELNRSRADRALNVTQECVAENATTRLTDDSVLSNDLHESAVSEEVMSRAAVKKNKKKREVVVSSESDVEVLSNGVPLIPHCVDVEEGTGGGHQSAKVMSAQKNRRQASEEVEDDGSYEVPNTAECLKKKKRKHKKSTVDDSMQSLQDAVIEENCSDDGITFKVKKKDGRVHEENGDRKLKKRKKEKREGGSGNDQKVILSEDCEEQVVRRQSKKIKRGAMQEERDASISTSQACNGQERQEKMSKRAAGNDNNKKCTKPVHATNCEVAIECPADGTKFQRKSKKPKLLNGSDRVLREGVEIMSDTIKEGNRKTKKHKRDRNNSGHETVMSCRSDDNVIER